jgi:sucrose phosphorylase
MQNQVQLITYVDRLSGGGLVELDALLAGPLRNLFGGVHLLPFFDPIDGADAGFDPIDHTRVDPRLGGWADVRALSNRIDVIADLIVNHISCDSPQFRDFQEKGAASEYAGLFLTRERVFGANTSAADVSSVYRPRPGAPFTEITLGDGRRETLWTTFTPSQVDLDVTHPQGVAYLERIQQAFAGSGVRVLRLDAVGYAVKKPGTSCFMIPETFTFIAGLAERAQSHGMEVLVEVHSHYLTQIEIAKQVAWVYDFALPPLVLHAFVFRTAKRLKEWLRIRPTNALTVLDTHDGIGIVDVGAAGPGAPGLVPPEELERVVEVIHENSCGASRRATGGAASNLDLYQVNCTYYDALARDDRNYLLARAIQFFAPGIPQVYYVGLLAGRNDLDLLARTGVGRDINRHYYDRDEVLDALKRPVVQKLCELIRLRNTHPAFRGRFFVEDSADDELIMHWRAGTEFAELRVRFTDDRHRLVVSHEGGRRTVDLLAPSPPTDVRPAIERRAC